MHSIRPLRHAIKSRGLDSLPTFDLPSIAECTREDVLAWSSLEDSLSYFVGQERSCSIEHHVWLALACNFIECLLQVCCRRFKVLDHQFRHCDVCGVALGHGRHWCTCKLQLYCGRTCQKSDWKLHKKVCRYAEQGFFGPCNWWQLRCI